MNLPWLFCWSVWQLVTTVLSRVSCPVAVSNSSGKPAHYKVLLEGDCVSGNEEVTVDGHATETYYITFKPGEVGKRQGR